MAIVRAANLKGDEDDAVVIQDLEFIWLKYNGRAVPRVIYLNKVTYTRAIDQGRGIEVATAFRWAKKQ